MPFNNKPVQIAWRDWCDLCATVAITTLEGDLHWYTMTSTVPGWNLMTSEAGTVLGYAWRLWLLMPVCCWDLSVAQGPGYQWCKLQIELALQGLWVPIWFQGRSGSVVHRYWYGVIGCRGLPNAGFYCGRSTIRVQGNSLFIFFFFHQADGMCISLSAVLPGVEWRTTWVI